MNIYQRMCRLVYADHRAKTVYIDCRAAVIRRAVQRLQQWDEKGSQ